MTGVLRNWARAAIPRRVRRAVSRRLQWPPIGRVDMGHLRRLQPISRDFGAGRGTPVDRHYIERFISEHSPLIRGRVLEIGTDMYTRQFGGDRVTQIDVLHATDRSPGITIVADLATDTTIPSETFDCIIFTQTLMVIYDVRAVVANLRRILKPAGVVLATASGISPISRVDMNRWGHYWSFTDASMHRLFETEFGSGNVKATAMGNVLSATAFLHGISVDELSVEELEHYDADYPVVVAAVAHRAP